MQISLYAIFQLLIPETENDGAKKGGKDCIHGGHQSFIVHRMGAFEFEIDDGGKTIVHDHYGEMGDTGGEGLVPALSGGDPQDGSHNENIGEDNEEQAPIRTMTQTRITPMVTEAVSFPQANFKRASAWQTKWWISLDPQKVR